MGSEMARVHSLIKIKTLMLDFGRMVKRAVRESIHSIKMGKNSKENLKMDFLRKVSGFLPMDSHLKGILKIICQVESVFGRTSVTIKLFVNMFKKKSLKKRKRKKKKKEKLSLMMISLTKSKKKSLKLKKKEKMRKKNNKKIKKNKKKKRRMRMKKKRKGKEKKKK